MGITANINPCHAPATIRKRAPAKEQPQIYAFFHFRHHLVAFFRREALRNLILSFS